MAKLKLDRKLPVIRTKYRVRVNDGWRESVEKNGFRQEINPRVETLDVVAQVLIMNMNTLTMRVRCFDVNSGELLVANHDKTMSMMDMSEIMFFMKEYGSSLIEENYELSEQQANHFIKVISGRL